jgi:hypothetical protein
MRLIDENNNIDNKRKGSEKSNGREVLDLNARGKGSMQF